jgi:hypothetical protein
MSTHSYIHRIFNSFPVTPEIFNKMNKLNINQNVSVNDVVNILNNNKIDLKEVPIGLVSKITFTEYKFFNDISIDDVFFIIISLCTLFLIILRNYNFVESKRFNFSKETKQKIRKYIRFINYFLGLVYIIYAIYMIRLVYCKKEFILISRYSYMYIYFISGITLMSTLYYYWRNQLIDQV